ncbi:MAG: PQQ-dependent sugar dehydrogenase [Pseudomonadales bacterium]|jgi:glucose/arabinose dehydrogenase|nr:PQQ-dependent sugar dehydrogenase [Pseudomonadales bacterium]
MQGSGSLSKVLILALLLIGGGAPVRAAPVFPGDHAVAPLFAGQTRAPLALKRERYLVSDFVVGLNRPWALAHLPDGRMLVTEVPGRLRVVTADGTVSAPLQGVPPVRPWGSRGLNDIALDPDFARNRTIYFTYLAAPEGVDADNSDAAHERFSAERQDWNQLSREEKAAEPWGTWRVAKARLSADASRITDVETLIETVPTRLAFDAAGKLLITTQRKSPMGEPDLRNTLGMVLRMNTDGSVPEDNPFVGDAGVNDLAWAVGLRNANSLELNPRTGEFWFADQGPTAGDELNVLKRGADYGWPYVSYGRRGETPVGTGMTTREGTEQPIYYWSPVSMAPSDMLFYTGAMFPGWQGSLFLTGLSSMHLARLELAGDHVVAEERLLDEPGHRLRHVSQGADGAIYVLQDVPERKILRISAPDADG